IAAVRIPSSLQAQITRSAISPRFAIRIFLNIPCLDVIHSDFQIAKDLRALFALEDFEQSRKSVARVLLSPDRHDHDRGHNRCRIANNSCPYSIGCPFATSFFTISPATSDSISFISFMASTMHNTCPVSTVSPGFTKGGAPGEGAS